MKKLFMNINTFVSIFALCWMMTGCGVVRRWTLNTPEAGNASLPATMEQNVFYDFLWTTPPITSREVVFDGNVATFEFGSHSYTLTRNDAGQIALGREGRVGEYRNETPSKMNLYYDLSILGTKVIPRQRLVTKTRYVTRYESVRKSRMVTKRVPVRKSRRVSYTTASGSTSYRTEYYTDYELRTVTEQYYTMEPVRRMETYTEWQTVYETSIDIPTYNVYTLPLENGSVLLVYKIDNEGDTQYYLQNPQYAVADDPGGYWGTKEVKILSIDANSNGVYFEDSDRVLFNSWNPYARDSRYQHVRNYMDNYWYTVADLKEERFIDISISADMKIVSIVSGNDAFIGVKDTGRIYIGNIPRKVSTVTINGKRYRQNRKGYFDAKIEYGNHRLRITHNGYEDFVTSFLIDKNNLEYRLDFEPALSAKAGLLKLENVSFRTWKVAVEGEDGKMSLYEGQNEISLKSGAYDVVVASGELEIKKKVEVALYSPVTIDVQKEIETMMNGNIPEVEGIQEASQEDLDRVEKNITGTAEVGGNTAEKLQ